MSSALQSSTVALLADAAKQAAAYEWRRAADLYTQVQRSIDLDHDPVEAARITELLAKSYFKGAFQSQTRQEFKDVMQRAESAYDQLKALYGRTGSVPNIKLSDARSFFAKYWLTENPFERKSLAEKSVALAEEAATIYEHEADPRHLAEARKELLNYFRELYSFSPDWSTLSELYERTMRTSEKAAREFEKTGDVEALLECLNIESWFLDDVAGFVVKSSEIPAIEKRSAQMGHLITKTVESGSTAYESFLANEALGHAQTDRSKSLKFFDAALSAANVTRDKLATGRILAVAGQVAMWASIIEEDVEKRRELLQKELEFAERAVALLEIPFSGHLLDWAYDDHASAYIALVMHVDTGVDEKKEHLRKAISWAEKGMAYQDHVAWPSGTHSKSRALYFLATLLEDPDEKRKLLEEAIPLREEAILQHETVMPYSWNTGVMHNYLALVRAELSKVEVDPRVKAELLKGAILEMEKCVELCAIRATSPEIMRAVAVYYEWYGDILNQLYFLNGVQDAASRSVDAYQEAIAYLTKSKYGEPIAQLRWKIARVKNAIGDFKAAATHFTQAANDYRAVAKRVPSLESVYKELSSYMDAWTLIDQARIYHGEERYSEASDTYSKAAGTLESTKQWSHLSKHYQACALIETAEAFSRQEKPEDSIQSFSLAGGTFRTAKEDLETRRRQNPSTREKEELEDWIKVTDGRIRYCLGRLELEEAKLLDRKGERSSSSSKFESASQIFKGLISGDESNQTRRELEALAFFSEAWARLKRAEEKSSPDLYSQASESFLQAYEVAEKKFRPLALANSAICKALQAGTIFRRTRDVQLYSGIKRELEAAADYYQEGGFQNAADWTQATQRLFDALLYLAEAETEREPRKKTELYHLAEKHLEVAAKRYDEAGFPIKKDEAQRHLRRVREEKAILLTPVEALAENPAMTEVATAPVSLVRDQAVGLERFEAASVVGNVTLRQDEVGVGSDVMLELEMANIGKTTAMLMKLENLAPEGLEIDREKIPHRLEDNFLDMKGKRLEYLKTHEAKIPMKAKRKGTFQLQPRILFVDEKGNYRSYEFEPRSITVKELGIGGWLKGPK